MSPPFNALSRLGSVEGKGEEKLPGVDGVKQKR